MLKVFIFSSHGPAVALILLYDNVTVQIRCDHNRTSAIHIELLKPAATAIDELNIIYATLVLVSSASHSFGYLNFLFYFLLTVVAFRHSSDLQDFFCFNVFAVVLFSPIGFAVRCQILFLERVVLLMCRYLLDKRFDFLPFGITE